MADGNLVIASTRFDPAAREVVTVPDGLRVTEIIARVLPGATPAQLARAEIWLMRADGSADPVMVPADKWHCVRPRAGTVIDLRIAPAGRNALRVVLTLAVVVAAAFIGPEIALALGYTATGSVAAAATAIVTAVGALAVNALVPIRTGNLGGGRQASETYSVSGTRNEAKPWGVVPCLLGRHRVYPTRIASVYTEVVGDDQYLRLLFGVIGPIAWEAGTETIGTTPLADYDDVEIQITQGLTGEDAPTLYPAAVIQGDLSVDLTHAGGAVTRTSAAQATELSVEIAFGRGLYYLNDRGGRTAVTVDVLIEYRPYGTPDWTVVTTLSITEAKGEAFRRGHRWIAAAGAGSYDVRLTRVTEDNTSSRVGDLVTWTALRSFRPYGPVQAPYPMALIAMRIRATAQLNGVVDTFSLIGTSIEEDYDAASGTWISRPTRQAAAHIRRVLTGRENGNPLALADTDLDSLVELDAWARERGWTYDRVHDYSASVEEVLADIAASARAICRPYNGRWTVMIDRPQEIAFGHITSRNARDVSGTALFPDIPDAFRVRFIDEANNWAQDERIVLRPGLVGAPVSFESGVEFPGVTQAARIWWEARRRFRELEARAETYSRVLDWEHVAYRPGQLVYYSHYLLDADQASARVSAVSGRSIVIDERVTMVAGQDYGVRFRRADWSSVVVRLVTRPGESALLVLADELDLPIEVGDLVLFGRATREAIEMVVKDVARQDGDAARITLVAHAPEINADDDEAPPEWVPQTTTPNPLASQPPAVPSILAISSGTPVMHVGDDGSVTLHTVAVIAAGTGVAPPADTYEVAWARQVFFGGWDTDGTDTVLASSGRADRITYTVGQTIRVRVRAHSPYGIYSDWSEWVEHTVQARNDLPPDVASLSVIVLPSTGIRRYAWALAAAAPNDLLGYQIRSRPGSGWGWEDLAPLHSGILSASPWDVALPVTSGVHTIGIVAVDVTGQASPTPSLIEVDLGPAYAGVILQRLEAALGWPGTITDGVVAGGALVSTDAALPSLLTYTLPLIDLGADRTVHVAATAYGLAGTISLSMQSALEADYPSMGTPATLGPVTARYFQITATISAASVAARLAELVTVVTEAV